MTEFSTVFLNLLVPGIMGFILAEMIRFTRAAKTPKSAEVIDRERHKIDIMLSLLKREISDQLTALDGSIQNADSDPAIPFTAKHHLTQAKHSVTKMTDFIHRLNLLHKIENPNYYPTNEPLNITTLIFEINREMFRLAENRGIKFHWEIDHALYHTFDCCYELFDTIISSLLANSMQFTLHGEVTFISIRTKSGIKITITDTGIGISELALQELYESDIDDRLAFAKQKGIGILLVRHAVRQLNGTISCKSTYGSGTTVTVELPLTEVPAGTTPSRMFGPTLRICSCDLPTGYAAYIRGCGHTVDELDVSSIESISIGKLVEYDLILFGSTKHYFENAESLTTPAIILTSEKSDHYRRTGAGHRLMLPDDLDPDELMWLSSCFMGASGSASDSSMDHLVYEPDKLLDKYVHDTDIASLLEWLREAAMLGDVSECEAAVIRLHSLIDEKRELALLSEAVSQYEFTTVFSICQLLARQYSVRLLGGRYV